MKKQYLTTFELILLALFSALVVVAKIALRLPLQLPGHSGLFWMAIVVVAAGIVPKRGAASLVGLTSGILAAFLGMGDFGALNTLLSYTMVGVGADLALWLLQNPENMPGSGAGRGDRSHGQVCGQVGAGHHDRCAAGLCSTGIGLVAGELCRLGGAGRHTRRADAQSAPQSRVLCLPGRETVTRVCPLLPSRF